MRVGSTQGSSDTSASDLYIPPMIEDEGGMTDLSYFRYFYHLLTVYLSISITPIVFAGDFESVCGEFLDSSGNIRAQATCQEQARGMDTKILYCQQYKTVSKSRAADIATLTLLSAATAACTAQCVAPQSRVLVGLCSGANIAAQATQLTFAIVNMIEGSSAMEAISGGVSALSGLYTLKTSITGFVRIFSSKAMSSERGEPCLNAGLLGAQLALKSVMLHLKEEEGSKTLQNARNIRPAENVTESMIATQCDQDRPRRGGPGGSTGTGGGAFRLAQSGSSGGRSSFGGGSAGSQRLGGNEVNAEFEAANQSLDRLSQCTSRNSGNIIGQASCQSGGEMSAITAYFSEPEKQSELERLTGASLNQWGGLVRDQLARGGSANLQQVALEQGLQASHSGMTPESEEGALALKDAISKATTMAKEFQKASVAGGSPNHWSMSSLADLDLSSLKIPGLDELMQKAKQQGAAQLANQKNPLARTGVSGERNISSQIDPASLEGVSLFERVSGRYQTVFSRD